MSKGSILVIGGGQNQCGLIRAARKYGAQVIVTDINSNPPGRKLADVFVSIDTKDKEANLEVAKRHAISGVVTDQTDAAVPTAAYVAESLGLPGIGYELAVRFTNKFVMRHYLKGRLAANIPDFHYFEHPGQADDWMSSIPNVSQWIVKPHTAQGSKGVSRLLKTTAQSQVWDAFRESNFSGILIESYIEGKEFSVEAFVEQGETHNLAVTVKEHYPENPCIDRRNLYLGNVSHEIERKLYQLNTDVIRHLGLEQGPTHAEYMVTNDGKVYLMEIAARGGGGNISEKLIPYLTDFKPTEGILRFSTGAQNEMMYRNYRERFAVMRFVDLPHGDYSPVRLPEFNQDWFLHFDLDLDRVFEARPVRNSADRLGYFIIRGETAKESLSRESQVMQKLQAAASGARK